MGKSSVIPNRKTTSVVINEELLKKAKAKGLNISLILDAALERELNSPASQNYLKSLEKKIDNLTKWMKEKNLEMAYYSDLFAKEDRKGVKNVVQKERERISF